MNHKDLLGRVIDYGKSQAWVMAHGKPLAVHTTIDDADTESRMRSEIGFDERRNALVRRRNGSRVPMLTYTDSRDVSIRCISFDGRLYDYAFICGLAKQWT
jgi:hypothetical protein